MRNTTMSIAAVMIASIGVGAAAAAEPGQTSIGGKAYIDISHIDQDSDGNATGASGTGLDAKRFYVVVDHQFDDKWSANLTTDFNYVSNDGETQLFVKKAYFQAKFSDAFVLRAGSADLPWVPFEEGLYGYRYIENVQIEHLHFATSADWGVHALGKVMDGKIAYAVALINGAGYKKLTRSQGMDLTGRISFMPTDKLTLAAGFHRGKLGQDTDTVTALHTASRYQLLAMYGTSRFRAAVEYFQADNWTQVLSAASDKADGYSLWGSYKLNDKVAVFGRYDDATPSKTLQPDLTNTYLNLGVAYKARGNVDIAFVYKYDKVEDGLWGTTNGTIGGVLEGKHKEIGIWTQVQF